MPKGTEAKNMTRGNCGDDVFTIHDIYTCGKVVVTRNIRYAKKIKQLHIKSCPLCKAETNIIDFGTSTISDKYIDNVTPFLKEELVRLGKATKANKIFNCQNRKTLK